MKNDLAGLGIRNRLYDNVSESDSNGGEQQPASPLDVNPYRDNFGRVRFRLPIVGTVPFGNSDVD